MSTFEAFWAGTAPCLAAHDHSYPILVTRISQAVDLSYLSAPVKTKVDSEGRIRRYFGTINYWPTTGRFLVCVKEGATPTEERSALATAIHSLQDPNTWPVHPCRPERLRITLYRYVDDHYLEEAAEEMFFELMDQEEQAVFESAMGVLA